MAKLNLILSTCGTSILTNRPISDEISKMITKYANEKNENDIPAEQLKNLKEHIEKRQAAFLDFDLQNAISNSAELAGIIHFYEKDLKAHSADMHWLLSTDTWLGNQTAQIVLAYLRQNGINNVDVLRIPGLQTRDFESFSESLSGLVKWCHEFLNPAKENYNIVFNLSGGFKSETGFLQVLGMFFADETIYIFERSEKLMRIPKLNIKFDDKNTIIESFVSFRRASLDLSVSSGNTNAYWMKLYDQFSLTSWGELVFGQYKKELYAEKVHESISERVVFGPTFLKSCEREWEHFEQINIKIDLLARYQEICPHPNPNSLDYKPLSGSPRIRGNIKSTHELDAWSDGNAKRIYCHVEGDKIILDELADALH